MANKDIRPYEISVWTLQDGFISVLKPVGLEVKGQTQNAKMGLKDDGENTISFDIPMYLYQNGEYIENPSWYNVINGHLLIDLRKIKVIFNKGESSEEIFEFIITKVSEKHEGFEKVCSVEGEGLAFHELGRQGYKITLSAEEFDNDYLTWHENGENGPAPVANINYWVDKVLANSGWDYEVQMDYAPYADMVLDTSKIYKDAFVSAWDARGGSRLIPATIEPPFERYAIIDGSESNRYNLLITIAEQFRVFCKFKYQYDDNYHIIGRKVIFYNNFIADKTGFIDLTYGYETKNLTREMDGVGLVSKMFVKPLSDSGLLTGEISIAESTANRSAEDYLLNFDYLYNIGTITDEQYAEIEPYEQAMRIINEDLEDLTNESIELNENLPAYRAKAQTVEDAIQEDKEGYQNANALYNSITDDNGLVSVTNANPKIYYLLKDLSDNSGYYINLEVEGIQAESIHIYRKYNTTTHELSKEVKSYTRVKDEFGNVIKLTHLSKKDAGDTDDDVAERVYAIFSYRPKLYYEKIKAVWEKREAADQATYDEMSEKVTEIETRLKEIETSQKALLAQQDANRKAFERLMGPALREGNWQPEDSYVEFKKTYSETFNLTATSMLNNQVMTSLGWDNNLFADEETNYYYNGVEQEKVYYPCIDLSNIMSLFGSDVDFREEGVFVYEDANYGEINDPRAYQYFPFAARCKFAFIRLGLQTKPVLMITDIYDIENFHNLRTRAWLGNVSFTLQNDSVVAHYDKKVTSLTWVESPESYEIVYPRFQINSTRLLANNSNIFISRNGKELTEFKDYYINFRGNKYFITLKPTTFLENGSFIGTYQIVYNLSNAAEAIYLDAIEVLKENSTPKVSYNVSIMALNESLIKTIYNKIGALAHINDAELKFEQVMGYISELNLDLDHPWQDEITIKNYKTKFEDLFSSILAQTEDIKKNSQLLGALGSMFTGDGSLNTGFIQDAIFDGEFHRAVSENALLVATNLKIASIENKAILAESNALKIINGDIGLAFPASHSIGNIQLNRDVGLLIEGYLDPELTIEGYFRVTNGAMGFFKKTGEGDTPLLYFEDGDLALSGTIYARNGWLGHEDNGWIIGEGLTLDERTYQGGLLYSMNHRAIFSAGTEDTSPSFALFDTADQPILVFYEGNLELTGTVHAAAGEIGHWHIEPATGDVTSRGGGLYYEEIEGTGIPGAIGYIMLSPGKTSTLSIANSPRDLIWSITAGNKFGVTYDGDLYAANVNLTGTIVANDGSIGSWDLIEGTLISSNGLVGLNSKISDYGATDVTIWAGDSTPELAPFRLYGDGHLITESGQIGPWSLTKDSIYYGNKNWNNKDGIYFGIEGLSFSDVFKIHVNMTANDSDGKFDLFEIDDMYGDYILRMSKRMTEEEELELGEDGATSAGYIFELRNIILGDDIIDYIASKLPAAGVVKTTMFDDNNRPIFPQCDYGTLGVAYVDDASGLPTIDEPEETTIEFSAPNVALTGDLAAGDPTDSREGRYKYFNLNFLRWNVVCGSDESHQNGVSYYGDWARAGVAQTTRNPCAMFSKVRTNSAREKGRSITVYFKWATQSKSSDDWDNMRSNPTRNPNIDIAMYAGLQDSTPVAKGRFVVPFTKDNLNNDRRDGSAQLSVTSDLVANTDYYICFYAYPSHTLIYVSQSSVHVGKSTSGGGGGGGSSTEPPESKALYVRTPRGWELLMGTKGLPENLLGVATATSLGGVKIGTGINVTTDGVISLPYATSGSIGGVKVGFGLSIDNNGVLSATYVLPVATATELGGVKIGTGIAVTSDGTISYTLPTASKTVRGAVQIGDGLSITSNGVLSYNLPTASSSTMGAIRVGTGLSISSGILSITTADASTRGGVKVNGSGLYMNGEYICASVQSFTCTPAYTTGTLLATITVNGIEYKIYQP